MLVVAIVIVSCVQSSHLLLTMMGCVCVLESLFKFYRLSYI